MVVGPNVPGVYANTDRVHLDSELGVTVLVFAIGLEFDLRRLIRLAPTAGLVALIQFAAMVGFGYGGSSNGLDTVGEPIDRSDSVDFWGCHHR
jgi:CPA2 family monovalent cation:H+ antiporter-2